MKTLALVTSTKDPDLIPEDRLLRDALRALKVNAQPLVWDTPHAPFNSFSAVVMRSPWNYASKSEQFGEWLLKLEASRVAVWNPIELLRWNYNKRYLLELASKGVRIVPSIFVEPEQFNTTKLVVKPAVSAGAKNTIVIDSAAIIQPFYDEIQTEGEWSLVFIAGEYSHAVLKRPAAGDFRVQEKFNGTWSFETPPAPLLEQARAITRHILFDWLYARVDGVRRGDEFILMELELFEPQLFIGDDSRIAERIARAFASKI